jgi:hypothetical protein
VSDRGAGIDCFRKPADQRNRLCIGIARTLHASISALPSAMTRAQAGAAGTIASLIASGAELASDLATTTPAGAVRFCG